MADWIDRVLEARARNPSGDDFDLWQQLTQDRAAKGWHGYEGDDEDAAAEHFAFSRSQTADNPVNALWLAPTIPAYAAYKALGFKPDATAPSLNQVGAAYAGMLDGLFNAEETPEQQARRPAAAELLARQTQTTRTTEPR